jgi:hypothetical protein
MPEFPPLRYRGYFQGGAQIADTHGRVLARRQREEGSGYVIADVDPRRVDPDERVPGRFWLHRRGPLSAVAWNTQRVLGRRWYAKHVAGLQPLTIGGTRTSHSVTAPDPDEAPAGR